MRKTLRILNIEDSDQDTALVVHHLTRAGYEPIIDRVDTPEAAMSALETRGWDVVLCDYSMPRFSALAALEMMKKMNLDIPFIIVSGTVGERLAVEAILAGAHGYVLKDNLRPLAATIEREMQSSEERLARRVMEIELEYTRDAALESVRLKSEFLANMSHEIRTPMNGVIGMTELLLQTEMSEQQQTFTRHIETSANALLKIINDILDFSKIEAGQLRFEKIAFDLRDSVELPIEMLARRAKAKGIKIISPDYDELPTVLIGDPGRLQQILTNLIGNAVKFTRQGNVTVNVIKEGETEDHAVVRFEVKDTGIGISDDARGKLFYAFVQADGSTTRKFGGTGLGLAISKQLVELMGGEIGVESRPGEGSTFWFTAQFEKTAVAVIERSGEPVSLAGMRVLIVDDEETNREIFLHQTAAWGMLGTATESGAKAMDLLRSASPSFDIAILDLMMLEMDGFDLARAIRADPEISDTKLLLMPAFRVLSHDEIVRKIGIDAYLPKPARQSELYNCLVDLANEKPGTHNGEPAHPFVPDPVSDTKTAINSAPSKMSILVAEDNAINREVAINQLRVLGYSPDVAFNGREAVDAVTDRKYDVVLMDCQMPEMDGFEATARIRSLKSISEDPVIVALTANALDGDREKCLAAGMDDYISKPVKIDELRRILKKWTGSRDKNVPPGSNISPPAKLPEMVDISVLAEIREWQQAGKPDLGNRLIDLFVEGAGKHIAALRKAVTVGDVAAIKTGSHAMKGSAGTIGAMQIAALAAELEQNAHLDVEAAMIVSKLESGFVQAVTVLDSMRKNSKE